MRFVIVTGISGAGKNSVLKMLEDAEYFCVDNLPIQLIPKMAQLAVFEAKNVQKVALGVDVRSKDLDLLPETLSQLDEMKVSYEILFLECSTEVLIKRYKETRHTHPLGGRGRVEDAIDEERREIAFLKEKADYILDTTHLLVRELKVEIDRIFVSNSRFDNFYLTVLSFGFKYGIPVDADLVFDVRFLPNPYYIPDLKPKSGNDKEVFEYVMASKEAQLFLDKLEDMLKFLIPNYIVEGKNQLVVAVGCTGGRHRSVTLANAITRRLSNQNFGIKVEHRDIEKG
ncbi:MAG: RNase adapter RapZ [Lachnospiraceae bacterium]|nr:RNase adapter RapZ [Lachnospiraceae bacterium]MBQ5561651.1 RNase adapter RapZ [Lachnospiraceae bacterium]MCR4801753.1 RNase adapter RapZ [Lachnospiraceae bacterium]